MFILFRPNSFLRGGGDKNECTKQSNETIKILEDKSNGDADDYHNDHCYAVVKDEFETL